MLLLNWAFLETNRRCFRCNKASVADDDTVTVDAAVNGVGRRQQVGYSERSCYTFDNKRGYCRSVHECYKLTKLHKEISNLETWILGTRGTCNYVEPTGRQVRPLFHCNNDRILKFYSKVTRVAWGWPYADICSMQLANELEPSGWNLAQSFINLNRLLHSKSFNWDMFACKLIWHGSFSEFFYELDIFDLFRLMECAVNFRASNQPIERAGSWIRITAIPKSESSVASLRNSESGRLW